MALQWQFARLDDLPIRDWYTVSAARIDVFVMEQNCPFQDNDGADLVSWHLLGWTEENNKRELAADRKRELAAGRTRELAAYCRIVDPGVKFPEPSIGRVVTPRAFRGCGYGKLLMKEALVRHDALYPSLPNKIGAQHRLEKFYGELGFVTSSEIYMEDGIPHVEMVRVRRS
jgi:ElaA protein